MSRLIVKNLPNKVNVEKLKEVFGEKGEITDVQLKYTKDGKFRNFGFIGYKNEEQATEAREYFNGTCINSMKIQVETCANLGDEKKPKAWSKYAPDSSAYKKLHKDENEEKEQQKRADKKERKIEKNKSKIKDLLKKHKDDPLFKEFLQSHVHDKTPWLKSALESGFMSDDDSGIIEENTEKANIEVPEIVERADTKIACKAISDLEYMKLLMKKVGGAPKKENSEVGENNQSEEQMPKKIRNRPLFHVKITGLPYKCKKKDIKEFFRPLVPYSIRLPLGKIKKMVGFCYAGFRTEKELKKALNKDKLFLGNHRVHVHKYEEKSKQAAQEEELNTSRRKEEKSNNEETICESGSIFVRNLPYVVAEEEVTTLFEKFGPLAEVNMPIDPISRQPKGFATVTYMIPEHAVKAYTELDGTAFCGRMLHLLPAKTEKGEDEEDYDGLSFKDKKAKKLKAQAKSSHNWNVLFLGSNAVADVIATNWNVTKEQLLTENNNHTSAAVRLALGETQLVAETRSFLEGNGVYLDAFNKVAKKRSKTCILVKNLPAGTDKDVIKALFAKHGHIARFLMPQHGITALVDFIEPFEAKKAFSKLAYSQFKNAPLYLEWAPENTFLKTAPKTEITPNVTVDVEVCSVDKSVETKSEDILEETEQNEDTTDDVIDTGEPENDTTLFVKNINFKTNEGSLKSHFTNAGKIHSVSVARKKDSKNPGQFLSMGYGFVQFYKKDDANTALKILQSSTLDGKTLELKRSERGNVNEVRTSRKSSKDTIQNGTKILVRNVPFQANRNELLEIFRAFGEIKTLRLPKKLSTGSEQHRGFAFVDYLAKSDAKTAFDTLCQSTHLYGRRLVLEWAENTDDVEDVNLLRKRTAQSFHAQNVGGKKFRKGAVDVETFVEGESYDV